MGRVLWSEKLQDTTSSRTKAQLGASTRRAAERSHARNAEEKEEEYENDDDDGLHTQSLDRSKHKGRPMLENFMHSIQRKEKKKKTRKKKRLKATRRERV